MLLRGQVDLTRHGYELVGVPRDNVLTRVAIGTILQQSPFYVVSSKKNPINSPKDMVGKVIGVVARGSGSENTLDMMLASAGIKPDTVRREVAGNGVSGFGLIEQGRIAAYVPSLGTVIRFFSNRRSTSSVPRRTRSTAPKTWSGRSWVSSPVAAAPKIRST